MSRHSFYHSAGDALNTSFTKLLLPQLTFKKPSNFFATFQKSSMMSTGFNPPSNTMRGTKRLSQSDSNPATNDAPFRSKRLIAASHFDAHREEPSRGADGAPLDVQRAESSRQHVRALNTQFARYIFPSTAKLILWVQSQLQSHPDELWEDGVQDYLSHASRIMDKFSDVVEWLKTNATKAESMPGFVSSTDNKLVPEIKKTSPIFQVPVFSQIGSTTNVAKAENTLTFGAHANFNKLVPETNKSTPIFQLPEKSVFGKAGSNPSFTSSWGSGALSKSPAPIMFGIQNSTSRNTVSRGDPVGLPQKKDDPDDAIKSLIELPEDKLEQPSSPSVKKTLEQGVVVVHEVKCKLYVKSSDPVDKEAWNDKGMGQLSIRCKEGVSKATKESKPTVIVRNDVGKILLNALIYEGIKTNLLKNAVAAIFHTSGDPSVNGGEQDNSVVARTYLIRTKTEEERNKLASAIQEYAPAA
ncbi:hypothetical protein GIB67_019222 [Kingdonia uniflora]|uniref:RanBD1 domain-containing protein n=1 Tax=Kingdonia uniflora TaxID=39325 RepID=A0A7J7MZY6_9MAGN|nr:hypothetical protein GIB67_019222 [Kingdonia uniflora]